MLPWNLYFLIKIVLHFAGYLALHTALNLALFALLIATNPAAWKNRRVMNTRVAKILRHVLLAGAALTLLLHEIGLSLSWTLWDQIKTLSGFAPDYIWELLERAIPSWIVWVILACFILIRVLDRYLRTSTWIAFALLSVMVMQTLPMIHSNPVTESIATTTTQAHARVNTSPAELLALGQLDLKKLRVARDQESAVKLRDDINKDDGPGQALQDFFERQAKIQLAEFEPTTPPDFDLIVLQICCMSWADLQSAKQSQHAFIRQADFMFENFNSAASHSGPAFMRLLRSKCGQIEHLDLNQSAKKSCMLFDQLRAVGFDVEMGLNHDGRFQHFATLVTNKLGDAAKQPVAYNQVPTGVLAFDGSQVGRDGDYLRSWWKQRTEHNKPAVAYYYNSITLHDGNRLPASDLNSLESYPLRLERLLNDLQSVLVEIKRSDRKALILVVPGHGAGITGEYGQLAGLRSIPTPAITRVPVLGYWIAPGYVNSSSGPATMKQPSSYTAIGEFLNRWIALPAEQTTKPAWPVLLNDLPSTRFVAQQGDITVMESQGSYWLEKPGSAWQMLSPAHSGPTP